MKLSELKLLQPDDAGAVEEAVGGGFGDVFRPDRTGDGVGAGFDTLPRGLEVGDGAGYPPYPGICPGRQAETAYYPFQKVLAIFR